MKIKIAQSPIECSNFVDGQLKPGRGPEFQVFSPYTGTVIGQGRHSLADDLAAAVDSSENAYKMWRTKTLKDRCAIMFNMREILIAHTDELSHLIASESGKVFLEAKAEILKAIEVLEFATSLQNSPMERRSKVSSGVFCEDQRVPIGVVAGITPFNFPAMVPFWMIPIAITLGNSFIWKPSEKTPLTSLKLAAYFKMAGLPDGVLNVIQGGTDTVEAIINHPKIAAIGFVGSSPVAKIIYEKGAAQGKRVLCLGGAKNHMILLPDANLEVAQKGIVASFTGCAGQRCMAGSVLLAVGNVENIMKKILASVNDIKLGQDMGAIITNESLQNLNSALAKSASEGAQLLVDGRNKQVTNDDPYTSGYWLGPSVLDDLNTKSYSLAHELFGPILSVQRCQSLEEALEIDQTSAFGNATSVFTQNPSLAQKVVESSKSGMIGVNVGVPVPREPYSFGGTVDSKFGHGDITGLSSIEFWTSLKKVTTKWFQPDTSNWMS